MQLRNSSRRYGIISIALHWIFALAVYGMFGLGLWMVTLSYYDGWYHQAPELHKSIGVLLMLGLVFRVVWRHISPPPSAPKSHGKMTRVSAVAAHIALYALLFAILISGYLISTADGKPISVFGLFDVPATISDAGSQADRAGVVHLWLAWSVVILSVLHGLAALKHHFIDKDDTLKRMLGCSSIDSGA
ncbi:cytochrome b [Enterobacter sichuanensis]|uniref:cytochrome b n=1 Tax=Enterobacter sichuanensis TaxID=2071710 RepID=UPI002DBCCE7B|nr:cytochrome b [Enterobacter sichuanensis]MEB5958938.1 cytochrome b [Enterobacter sichuanensis]